MYHMESTEVSSFGFGRRPDSKIINSHDHHLRLYFCPKQHKIKSVSTWNWEYIASINTNKDLSKATVTLQTVTLLAYQVLCQNTND